MWHYNLSLSFIAILPEFEYSPGVSQVSNDIMTKKASYDVYIYTYTAMYVHVRIYIERERDRLVVVLQPSVSSA